MKKLFLFFVAAIILVAQSACDKQKFRGPRGITGPQGAQGPEGPAGKDAEITSSGAFTIGSDQWDNATGTDWRATIATSLVTSEVIQRGSVQVLLNIDEVWYTLPYFEHTLYTTFAYEPGKVYLIRADSHGSLPARPETATFKFSVIIDADRVIKNDRLGSSSTAASKGVNEP